MGAYLWAGVDSGWLGSRIQKKCFCTKYPAGRPISVREGLQTGFLILLRLVVAATGDLASLRDGPASRTLPTA